MATMIWRSQNSFSGGVISEKLFGRVELEQYRDSVAIMRNAFVQPHGGFTRRSGTKFGWACKDASQKVRVIAFEFSQDEAYCLEFGDHYIRFGKNGVLLRDGSNDPIEISTPWPEEDLFGLKFVQNADVMWIVHRNHRPQKLLRYADDEWYLDPVSFIDGPYFPINSTGSTMVASAATGTVTVTAANGAAITNVVQGFKRVWVGGTPVDLPEYLKITTGTKHGLVSGSTTTISGVVGTTEANGTWQVIVIDDYNFHIPGTLVNPYVSGGVLTPNIFAATDVGRLIRIWNSTDAKWAWGEISAYTNTFTVSVIVVENNFPTSATVLWRLGKYSDTSGWPGAVMLYEQRLGYAASPQALQDVDFSQTDKYDWFQTAADETLLATDAISWTLASRQIDNIAWMETGRGGLAIGTSGGCWIMTGAQGKDDPLTPSSVNAKKHEAIGVDANVLPVPIDNAVLFVDKSGERVHEFAYLWEDDTYRAPDLIILAEHLTADLAIAAMDVQKGKKMVFAVLNNGEILGLTYMRAEKVVAWHQHDLPGGSVESLCVVNEGQEETPYMVVARTINGQAVKYVEYMEPQFDSADIKQAYYVDAGIEFALDPVDTVVSGLDHLEGEAVYALVDGKVVKDLTVTGGQVTLPYAGGFGCVGLNYFSDVETVPIELVNDQGGATIGRVKDLGEIKMRVSKSYAAKVGRNFDAMEEVKFNENLKFGTAVDLFSGEKRVESIEGHPATDVRVCVRQDLPLPLTVTAITTRLLITED